MQRNLTPVRHLLMTAVLCVYALLAGAPAVLGADGSPLSPTALVLSSDGKELYIACADAKAVLIWNTEKQQISERMSMPGSPSGLALGAPGHLLVTCAGPESTVCQVDLRQRKIVTRVKTGHTAMAPVPSPDGKRVYVCNRFNNRVAVIDLSRAAEIGQVPVEREPVAAALTPDGKRLIVVNHIHAGRSDAAVVAGTVSIIDTESLKVVKQIALPNGSTVLRGVAISPDGRYACVTHVLARFHLPTTQLDRGWMNSNGLSLIDLAELKLLNTVLLDNVDAGAANPWAAVWTPDGKEIWVTHAGTHEVSIIQFGDLLARLARLPEKADPSNTTYISASRSAADVPNDLAFLVGLRQRIKLPGNGPRALCLGPQQAFVANYFSDDLNVLERTNATRSAQVFALGAKGPMTVTRKGEMLFNDATLCFQGWQTCGSCHSSDARVDGLNWDLLNDGIGNPKNVKSMLLAHQTPPAMSQGVRDRAETAVRAGIRYILFTVRPEEDAEAIDEYLKSLQPIPSPYLVKGQLSPAAKRGKQVFNDPVVGCASCHPAGLFTNLKSYDVGTKGELDNVTEFDTPTLIETWRSGPYLHTGAAATMRDVLTTTNSKDTHGKTSHLTRQQVDDLAEYVLSL